MSAPTPDRPSVVPGDVLRIRELGPIRADEHCELVVLFLGACREEVDPDVPAFLRSVGFARTHLFEAELAWRPRLSIEDPTSTFHVFSAASPPEAVRAAVRLARREERRIREGGDPDGLRLVGLFLRLVRAREVGPGGELGDWRGDPFAAWSARSGRPLEDLLERLGAPTPPVG